MMFLDGDSMIVPLFSRSLLEGTASDWAMSAVFFVPELVAFTALLATGLEIHVVQFLSAFLNFIGLYVVFRTCSSWLSPNFWRQSGAAMAGYLAVCVLALLEGGGDRNSFELASLLAMTTYYAATVLGSVLAVGLVQKIVSSVQRRSVLEVALLLLVIISAFSNPIFIAWAIFPLVFLMVYLNILMSWQASSRRVIVILLGGSIVGYALRLPLAPWVVADSENYFRPSRAQESVSYYWNLLMDRAVSEGGVAAITLTLALMILGAVLSVKFVRKHAVGPAIVATYSWLAPISTTIGFVLLGTEAARYLQMWAFAPALSLIVLVSEVLPHSLRNAARKLALIPAAAIGIIAVSFAGIALPSAVTAFTTSDRSLACAVNWVNNTERSGAGQFWSVRAIKTYADDPSQLLQTDDRLNGYSWLVDRRDFSQRTVSFLITDAQSSPFALPAGYENLPSSNIDCGRFQITDFGHANIPVGPLWP
ncbi:MULTISPECIES: hypothetical protein [unclassified Salinibacterium]|uniref:hypothetical protein n=1 Tax=unclassified Salinibacterium TaxID=2632331 RepID=UPI001E373289|nr:MULTISPECIES: hypothetical protein [unclassified Salinibacterium]